MGIDVRELRRTIRDIEERVSRLNADVAQLRQIAERADNLGASGIVPGLHDSPQERGGQFLLEILGSVRIPHPLGIGRYLRRHPDLSELIADIGRALVNEFQNEPSDIELVLYKDPEIDDEYLAFYVRVREYEDDFIDRLNSVLAPYEDRRSQGSGWILVTSDFVPVE